MKPPGVSVVLPHMRFARTPDMTPLQIARLEGREARMLGRPEHENPYTDEPHSGEWTRGYTDGRR